MKTRHKIVIRSTPEQIWALFDDATLRTQWQQALESLDLVKGEAGQPGAVSELVYALPDGPLRLTETISERREPDFLAATCEGKGVRGLTVHHFERLRDGESRWIVYSNYRISGLRRWFGALTRDWTGPVDQHDLQRFKLLFESKRAEPESPHPKLEEHGQ